MTISNPTLVRINRPRSVRGQPDRRPADSSGAGGKDSELDRRGEATDGTSPFSEAAERGGSGRIRLKPITEAAHRLDPFRLARVGLDFGPQAADVDIDRAGVDRELVAPDLAQER